VLIQVKHLRLWIFECREPSEDAFKLGLAAAGILVLAHVIANFLGGACAFVLKKSFKELPLIDNCLWHASFFRGK
jgi:hypothetical protein